MEAQGQEKYSSKISAESRKSYRQSCRSLERPSWSSRDHSLNKNRSLIQVMSLQGSRKSDLYEKILAGDMETIQIRKSNPLGKSPPNFLSSINPIHTEYKRLSYEKGPEIQHICLCYLKCRLENCPCFDAAEELCDKDLCCEQCVTLKNNRNHRGNEVVEKAEKIFCTCKKTKCNKRYCSCFAAGVKCGIDCNCEDCLNCDKVQRMEQEPVCIVDDEIKKMSMPESMEFQPWAFRYSYNN